MSHRDARVAQLIAALCQSRVWADTGNPPLMPNERGCIALALSALAPESFGRSFFEDTCVRRHVRMLRATSDNLGQRDRLEIDAESQALP